jgi:hypothetical protein
MTILFTLLVVYQLKHFLADYPLQTPYMLKKFLPGWDFVKPLACHAGVHGLFTFFIAFCFRQQAPLALGLASLDFTVHFIVDRIKASPKLLGRFKAISADEFKSSASIITQANEPRCHPEIKLAAKMFQRRLKSNTYFWWALGWDQMMHHLTHYVIIWCLITSGGCT